MTKGHGALGRVLVLLGAVGSLMVLNPAPAHAAGHVLPIFECSFKNPDNSYTTVWGYDNQNAAAETHGLGPGNRFQPLPYSQDQGQGTVFQPGRHDNTVTVPWDGTTDLRWTLDVDIAHANTTTTCASNPVPITGSGLSPVFAVIVIAGGGVVADLCLRRKRRRAATS